MRVLFLALRLILLFAAVWLTTVYLWPAARNALRYADLMRQPGPTAASLSDPLPGVRFADTWGGARSEGRRHEGVDIFAPRGTPIRATTEGIVLRIGENRLGGHTVMITGPGGYRHYYAHLERYPDLKDGDWVEVGTVVGYVGDSGNARGTPPHLHYGVYRPVGGAINPYPLIGQG